MVPVKNAAAKPRRAAPRSFLDDFEIDLEHFWRRPFASPPPLLNPFRALSRERMTWAPRMDVYGTDDAIIVQAELPGLKRDDVQVEIEGDNLVIRGESKAASELKDEDYYRSERRYGSFYRRMPIPEGVIADQIQAKLADGVLEVRLPMSKERAQEPTRIEIK
jgi:HSP20 family protein